MQALVSKPIKNSYYNFLKTHRSIRAKSNRPASRL